MPDPVSTQIAAGTSSVAATAVNFTASAAGTLLVLSVSSDDYRLTTGTSRPEANGWTVTQSISTGFHGAYMWHKIATGAETSVTYSIGSAAKSVYVLSAHTNVDQASPLDVSAQQIVNTSGASYTTPTSGTTSAGRRLGIAQIGGSNGTTLFTGAGLTTWIGGYTALGTGGITAATPGLVVGQAVLVFDGGAATSSGASYVSTNAAEARSGIIAVFDVATAGRDGFLALEDGSALLTETGLPLLLD